jgi:hypothetical protein
MIGHAIAILVLPVTSIEFHTGALNADPGAVMAAVAPDGPRVISLMTPASIIIVIIMVASTVDAAGGSISLVVGHARAHPVAPVGTCADRVR